MPSKIEWCDETLNVISGCTPISEGCQNCYALKLSKRLQGRCGYDAKEPFQVTYHPDKLVKAEHWKKPRKIFLVSMGDMFHEDVKNEWINNILMMVYLNQQHTFMVLTKRPERMRRNLLAFYKQFTDYKELKNLWIGVSCENKKRADERIPILLDIPAVVRFVSFEPLLESLLLTNEWKQKLDWIIVGGEKGHRARKCWSHWIIGLWLECQKNNIPFFFKQWGNNSTFWNNFTERTVAVLKTRQFPKEKGKPLVEVLAPYFNDEDVLKI